MAKVRLGINIDHIATVRNARNRDPTAGPDLLRAAQEAIHGGADSITFHLREDRRHVMDADVKRLCDSLKVPINLEMAATDDMKKIARARKPYAVCLVPEKRKEVTTEGGLNVVKGGKKIALLVRQLRAAHIRVSLFIAPTEDQVRAAAAAGAAAIELHTGTYANSKGIAQKRELRRLQTAARLAHALNLEVHAGHGLTYQNAGAIAAIPEIQELNIGHFLVGEALFVGLRSSVRRMRQVIDRVR